MEGEIVGLLGVEGAFGLVIDTDNLFESGLFYSSGIASGASAGYAIGIGWAKRDIEGKSFNIDVNIPVINVSGTASFDNQGFNSWTIALGPGGAISSVSDAKTFFTVDDIYRNYLNLVKYLTNPFRRFPSCP